MRFTVNPADPRPIYVQIMDEIRRAIVLGVLLPDDPVPSLRQLATDMRVNPNTVAQAYRELERAGVVYVRRGQGTFVAHVAANRDERPALVTGVAERALMDAHRNAVGVEELLEAIRELAATRDISSLLEQL